MREANALRRAGDDTSALKLFQRAYELNKTPKALAQIGLAEQALGKWSAADKHLRQSLESGDEPWIRKNRSSIDMALSLVATHVGQLEVSGTPAGAEVRVDGESEGTLPLARPITVTAGGVAIEVTAPGYLPIVRSTTITARTLTREIFKLTSMTPAGSAAPVALAHPPQQAPPTAEASPTIRETSPAGPAPTTSVGSARLALVLVSGGLAAASLALGIVEHLSWQNQVNSFATMTGCGTSFVDKGAVGCKSLYDDGQQARTLAFVGYGLSAAFAATTIILLVTDPGPEAGPRTVACVPTAGTPGVGCAFRF